MQQNCFLQIQKCNNVSGTAKKTRKSKEEVIKELENSLIDGENMKTMNYMKKLIKWINSTMRLQ